MDLQWAPFWYNKAGEGRELAVRAPMIFIYQPFFKCIRNYQDAFTFFNPETNILPGQI